MYVIGGQRIIFAEVVLCVFFAGGRRRGVRGGGFSCVGGGGGGRRLFFSMGFSVEGLGFTDGTKGLVFSCKVCSTVFLHMRPRTSQNHASYYH